METSRARIFELENEIKLLARDVSRLHEYEDMIQTLSRKIMDLEAVVRVEEEEVGRRKPSGIAMDDHSDEASGHGLAVTKRLELLEEENSILQKSVRYSLEKR